MTKFFPSKTLTHKSIFAGIILMLLFQYWMLGILPIAVVVINLCIFSVCFLPNVDITEWFLAVYRNETTVGTACFSIILNFICVAFGIAGLFMFGDIVDSSGRVLECRWSHVYLAVVTLTTLGYGNIVPSGFWSEFVAVFASIIGFTGFALLAGVFSSVFYAKLIKDENR